MDWFRALLARKARSFQIVVFTCRPDDYLAASAMPNGMAPMLTPKTVSFVRSISDALFGDTRGADCFAEPRHAHKG